MGYYCSPTVACLVMLFESLPNDKNPVWSKLKAFADNKVNVISRLKFALGKVENIVEKEENAGNQHFLLI